MFKIMMAMAHMSFANHADICPGPHSAAYNQARSRLVHYTTEKFDDATWNAAVKQLNVRVKRDDSYAPLCRDIDREIRFEMRAH